MALNRERLCKVGGGGLAPQVWSYKTEDATGTVDGANYFQTAGDLLRLGDIIIRTTVTNIETTSEAWASTGFHVINSRSLSAGTFTVDATNQLAGPTVDSD